MLPGIRTPVRERHVDEPIEHDGLFLLDRGAEQLRLQDEAAVDNHLLACLQPLHHRNAAVRHFSNPNGAHREASRRASCQNTIRQWGLAMQNFHSAQNKLPEGNRINPRRVWVVYTWPYVEDQTHAAQYDQTVNFDSPPNTIYNTTDGIYAKTVPIYYCASDRPGAMWKGDSAWRARGNYVINWAQIAITNCRTSGPTACPARRARW